MKDVFAKLFFDFLSAIVFLVVYLSTGNVVLATSIAIAGALAQVAYSRIKGQPLAFMTYASLASPYCPDPRKFHDTTIGRFNEGCLFWVYIGHGHPTGLDRASGRVGQPRSQPMSAPPATRVDPAVTYHVQSATAGR